MRNRLGFLGFVGLCTALLGCGCDGPTACQSTSTRIQDVCGAVGFEAFAGAGGAALDQAGFESECGTANTDCQTCVDGLLADAAGCASLADCQDECVGIVINTDAGPGDAGGDPDTGVVTDPCTLTPGRAIGAACSRNSCTSPLTCEEEQMGMAPSVLPDLMTAGPMIPVHFNPNGGLCTVACDEEDDCNDCSTCIGADADGPGLCQSDCTPTLTDNGGCRNGWSCSIYNGTCGLSCSNDDFCKITGTHDANGDGTIDSYVYDPDYPGTCNMTTGRCEVMGTAGAAPGDPCTEDSDCEDNGLCLTGDAWPGGYCARIGCLWSGFECADGAVCDNRNLGVNICMQGCTVGAEPDADALGVAGNGAGCADGFMCSWDGTHGPTDTLNGACLPGNYNDVTVPNVAMACQTAEDCYSPYGGGRCLWGTDESEGLRMTGDRVGSGMCVIQNCAQFMEGSTVVEGLLPGVAATTRVCDFDAGERCVDFSGGAEIPFTLCILTCANASECAPGYGCIEFFSDGTRACWPTCAANADCRTGATCNNTGGTACDADGPDNMPNTADDETCVCSDAVPRMPMPDAGTPSEDAGTPAADAGVDAG